MTSQRSESKRFVLFPISLDPIWQKYKSLETTIWFAEDVLGPQSVKVSNVNLPVDAATACLRFVAATQAAAPTRVISTVCTAPEFACYLGFQEFMGLIHLECAARVVADGVGDSSDVIEPPVWSTLCELGTRDDVGARLTYYYAFWAAWTKAFTAWVTGLPTPCSSDFREMVDKMALDAAQFKAFAADACGIFLGQEGIALPENIEFMEDAFRCLAKEMGGVLGIGLDVMLGGDSAAQELAGQKSLAVAREASTEYDDGVFTLMSEF